MWIDQRNRIQLILKDLKKYGYMYGCVKVIRGYLLDWLNGVCMFGDFGLEIV